MSGVADLTAIGCGVLIGGGLALFVAAFVLPPTPPGARVRRRVSTRALAPLAVTIVVSVAVWMITGWTAAAVGAGGLAGYAAASILGRRDRPGDLDVRLDALAVWCEQLRDLLRAGAMLPSAIAATTATVPTPLVDAVVTLSARLEREHPARAFRRFADTVDDQVGDLVASVLLTATEHSGNTAHLLTELAATTRSRVERHKLIEAERAGTRNDARIIIVIAVGGLIAMLAGARSEYMAPYRSATGQVVLAVVFAMFASAIWWTQRLSRIPPAPRFLTFGVEELP
jgi:Flp pilus assembly protein TadB